eukprot:scaffold1828_cov62-Phaeocystis_antarctica.AAC.7
MLGRVKLTYFTYRLPTCSQLQSTRIGKELSPEHLLVTLVYAALAVHTLRIEVPALAALAVLATVALLVRSSCRGENTAGVLLRGCPPKMCSRDSSELGHGERSLGTPSLPLPLLPNFAEDLGLSASSAAAAAAAVAAVAAKVRVLNSREIARLRMSFWKSATCKFTLAGKLVSK